MVCVFPWNLFSIIASLFYGFETLLSSKPNSTQHDQQKMRYCLSLKARSRWNHDTYDIIMVFNMYCDHEPCGIDGCTFENNTNFVGLIHCTTSSNYQVNIVNSVFKENHIKNKCWNVKQQILVWYFEVEIRDVPVGITQKYRSANCAEFWDFHVNFSIWTVKIEWLTKISIFRNSSKTVEVRYCEYVLQLFCHLQNKVSLIIFRILVQAWHDISDVCFTTVCTFYQAKNWCFCFSNTYTTSNISYLLSYFSLLLWW